MKRKLSVIAGAALTAASLLSCQTAQGQNEPIMVGSYEVYVLQEAASAGSAAILIDAPSEVLAEYAPDGTFPMATNAVLIRRGENVWLVDTGYGKTIFDRMAALGIEPGDIDEVLITHMHGDHTGGMLREGAKAFPNAAVKLSQRELDHWTDIRDESATRIFTEYGNAVRTLSPVEIDAPVRDGITPVAAYGHTPGHTMFMIADGDERLLIWGDLTHAMAVQMPHPEISVRYDTDPDAAREARLKILRHVASNNIPVVGMHIPATTAGKISPSRNGYEFHSAK